MNNPQQLIDFSSHLNQAMGNYYSGLGYSSPSASTNWQYGRPAGMSDSQHTQNEQGATPAWNTAQQQWLASNPTYSLGGASNSNIDNPSSGPEQGFIGSPSTSETPYRPQQQYRPPQQQTPQQQYRPPQQYTPSGGMLGGQNYMANLLGSYLNANNPAGTPTATGFANGLTHGLTQAEWDYRRQNGLPLPRSMGSLNYGGV